MKTLTRKSSVILLCIICSISTAPANAAIVKYVVSGQLELLTNWDGYYQTDLYDLDGAYYTRVMIVDTSVAPDYYNSGVTTEWYKSSGFLISNAYYITGRPNEAADLNVYTSISGMQFQVMTVDNAYSDILDAYYDNVILGSTQQTGVLSDLYASGEGIYFGSDFIPGNNGYVTEPPYPFNASDIDRFSVNVWNYAPGGHTGLIDGKELSYGQSLLSAYATVVPIPPALWLFGSGLLGLIGISRRRKPI